MHGLKSAILTIFKKSANWLDWPCPVSAALQNRPQDFFSLLYFNFQLYFYISNHCQKQRLVFWSFRSRSNQCGTLVTFKGCVISDSKRSAIFPNKRIKDSCLALRALPHKLPVAHSTIYIRSATAFLCSGMCTQHISD